MKKYINNFLVEYDGHLGFIFFLFIAGIFAFGMLGVAIIETIKVLGII